MLAAMVTAASHQASYAQPLPVPDETVLARLAWTTMIALDNANRTGDYSVLRALGTPDFQSRNSEEDLTRIFAALRDNRVDVGKAVLVSPTWLLDPGIASDGTLRLRGGFEYRPKAIRFDILFRNIDGGWRILALSVAEIDSAAR